MQKWTGQKQWVSAKDFKAFAGIIMTPHKAQHIHQHTHVIIAKQQMHSDTK